MAYTINAGDVITTGFKEINNRIAGGDVAHEVYTGNEAEPRFQQTAVGDMKFGNGSSPVDTEWRRAAPGNMRCPTGLVIADGGIGVGNSASATTPGSVTKKIQGFDESGLSLGFIAVYSSIT
jgi:hypothetical protein